MPGRGKRKVTESDATDVDGDDYDEKRRRNNEAVRKSRLKSRMKESETSGRVAELREENSELEKRVEVLDRELKFLKDMFIACAKGNGGKNNMEIENKNRLDAMLRSDDVTVNSNEPSTSNYDHRTNNNGQTSSSSVLHKRVRRGKNK